MSQASRGSIPDGQHDHDSRFTMHKNMAVNVTRNASLYGAAAGADGFRKMGCALLDQSGRWHVVSASNSGEG